MKFKLIEINFEDDFSIESTESLIRAAHEHCEHYPERAHYLPIDDLEKAIKYWVENNFRVKPFDDFKVKRDDKGEITKVSTGYNGSYDCYEIELIKNNPPCDTTWRIEMMDNDYLNVSAEELKMLRDLLNSELVVNDILNRKEK